MSVFDDRSQYLVIPYRVVHHSRTNWIIKQEKIFPVKHPPIQDLKQMMPPHLKSFLQGTRLDHPQVTFSYMWPALWGLGSASGCMPDLMVLATIGLGGFALRSVVGTFDDICYRSDKKNLQMSKQDSIILLAGETSVAVFLLLKLNWTCVLLGLGYIPLLITYPLVSKSQVSSPLMLGLISGYGSLIGWSSIQGSCDLLTVVPLCVAGMAWTALYHDINIHNQNQKLKLLSCTLSCLLASGVASGQSWPFYTLLTLTGFRMLKDVYIQGSSARTKSKNIAGWLIFLGISLSALAKYHNANEKNL